MRPTSFAILLSFLTPTIVSSQIHKLDTTARPTIFETSFLNDTSYFDPFNPYKFYTVNLGKIKIESGEIIVCDPIEMHIAKPFATKFPIGNFPVQLAVMIDGDTSNKVTAYCRIKFSDKPVTKWTLALKPGEEERKITEFHPNEFYYSGIGVGVGVLLDKIANANFIKKSYSEWGGLFVNRFINSDKKGFLYRFNGHSLATYDGFDGSGCRAYIGYDVQGNICRLLVDGGMYAIPLTQF